MQYLVVIERGRSSFGAYVPDLPGIGVAGRSVQEVKRLVKQAVKLHIEGLRDEGLPVPKPAARSHTVQVRPARARRASAHIKRMSSRRLEL